MGGFIVMARLFLRIQVNKENADSVPMQIETDDSENNVSSLLSNRASVPENDGINGKSFGGRNKITGEQGWLDLSDGYLGGANAKLQSEKDKYKGFMFGVTNDKGEYELTLEISGGEIEKVVVLGDKEANQFPTKAYLDGSTTPIYSDDANWAIKFPSEALTHTIKFTNWNRADYNACFTTLKILATYLDLNRAYIEDLDTLTQSSSDPTTIQNGVLANSGSVNLADIDGELRDLFEDGIIENSNVPVEVWLNGKKIRTHITTDSDYEENAQLLKFQMTNGLSNWDNLTYGGRAMTRNESLDIILREVLENLYTKAEVTKALSTKIVFGADDKVGTVEQYLSTINIPYAYLNSDTYRNTVNKICDVAQLQCYADSDDKPVFVSSRPVATQEEIDNAVRVKSYTNITNLQRSVILKNKYDGIDGEATKVTETINVGTNVGQVERAGFTSAQLQYGNRQYKDISMKSKYSVCGKLEGFYYSGSFIINKKTNSALNDITSLNMTGESDAEGYRLIKDESGNFPYELQYQYDRGSFIDEVQAFTDITTPKDTPEQSVFATSSPYSNVEFDEPEGIGDIYTGKLPTSYSILNSNKSIGLADESYIKAKEFDTYYDVKFKILAKIIVYEIEVYMNFWTGVYESFNTIYIWENIAKKATISIYGTQTEITFPTIDISTANIETAKTPATITANELLQTEATISSANLISNMKNNILSDYKNGVMDSDIELFPDEFVNKDGNVVVSYKAGELIEPNKVIYFDGDLKNDGSQRYWRVKGSHFRFATEPTISVGLQDIVKIYEPPTYTITISSHLEAYNEAGERIYSGAQVKCGDRIKFVFIHSSIDYKFNGVWVNNKFSDEGLLERTVYATIWGNSIIKAEYDLYSEKTFKYVTADDSVTITKLNFNLKNDGFKDIIFNFNNGQVEYDLTSIITDELQEVHNANTDIMGQFAFSKTYMTQQNMNDDQAAIETAYNKPMKITALIYDRTVVE